MLIIPKIEKSGNNHLQDQRLINFALPPEYLSPCTLILDEAATLEVSSFSAAVSNIVQNNTLVIDN